MTVLHAFVSSYGRWWLIQSAKGILQKPAMQARDAASAWTANQTHVQDFKLVDKFALVGIPDATGTSPSFQPV